MQFTAIFNVHSWIVCLALLNFDYSKVQETRHTEMIEPSYNNTLIVVYYSQNCV